MDAIAIASLVVALAAVAIYFIAEWLKRPRLEVVPRTWQAKVPTGFTFAAVEVRNRPLPHLVRSILLRGSATGCEVTLEFREPGTKHLAIPRVPARWSSQPEPFRLVPTQGSPQPQYSVQFDPTIVPQTLRLDVPAADVGYEVAVAMLTLDDGKAYAWGAESYGFPASKNPAWELKRQVYEVKVIATASGVAKSRRFLLDNLEPDFAKFSRLIPA